MFFVERNYVHIHVHACSLHNHLADSDAPFHVCCCSKRVLCVVVVGASLHHASGVRGDAVERHAGARRGATVPRQDHVALLPVHGALHGTRSLRGEYHYELPIVSAHVSLLFGFVWLCFVLAIRVGCMTVSYPCSITMHLFG